MELTTVKQNNRKSNILYLQNIMYCLDIQIISPVAPFKLLGGQPPFINFAVFFTANF